MLSEYVNMLSQIGVYRDGSIVHNKQAVLEQESIKLKSNCFHFMHLKLPAEFCTPRSNLSYQWVDKPLLESNSFICYLNMEKKYTYKNCIR